MNYYPFHAGDYLRDTAHLDPMEDITYRRLLDMYYQSEKPIPLETDLVSRRLRLGSDWVISILKEFFQETPDGWRHRRCDAEIADYNARSDRARENGKAGGRPKKTQPVISGLAKQTQPKTNQNQNQNQNQNHLEDSSHVVKVEESKPSKPAKKPTLANDETWLKELEADPTYTGIDIRQELGKMQQWCKLKGKQPTRMRFLNWIGRADRKAISTPAQFSFPLSEEQREIATWFGREPDDWTVEERATWDRLPMVTGDDFTALQWFYRESGYKYLRQTLPALLHNWKAEIDKAKTYDPDKP